MIIKYSELYELGLSAMSASIVKEAFERDITCILLADGKTIQLGLGAAQKRISGSFTGQTGFIGIKLSGNKEVTKKILSSMGMPVPKGVKIYNAGDLWRAISIVGYPIVIKPVRGNHGRGISLNIHDLKEAQIAFKKAENIARGRGVIVERYFTGNDYRLLVINHKLAAAAKRTPAMITGDGHSSVQQLIDITNEDPRRGSDHSKALTFIKIDSSSQKILEKAGLSLTSVLPENKKLFLKEVANISAGGTAADVTEMVHPDNIAAAERMAKIIGLDICGIDIISPDIAVPFNNNNAVVVEVNSGPGFWSHMSPSEGQPRNIGANVVDMLFPPGTESFIPCTIVTGSEATKPVHKLLTDLLDWNGLKHGAISSEGLFINGIKLLSENLSYPEQLELLLKDPSVERMVIECPTHEIIKKENVKTYSNTIIFTGLSGSNPTSNLGKIADQVSNQLSHEGMLILNAADDLLVETFKLFGSHRIAYFSVKGEEKAFITHVNNGCLAATLRGSDILLYRSGSIETVDCSGISTHVGLFLNYLLPVFLTGIINAIDTAKLQEWVKKIKIEAAEPDLSYHLKIGIEYLLRCIKADGSFVYRINAETGIRSQGYNILRHAGALFILYQWRRHSSEKTHDHLLQLSIDYLSKQIRPLPRNVDMACVIERGQAKLGGAALTLLAFIEKYKVIPLAQDLTIMRQLANFIVWMQEDNGKFKSKLAYRSLAFSTFHSTYYPGEAILALVNFYKVDNNPLWLKTAERGITYLINHPVLEDNGQYGHNHWFATALSEYYRLRPKAEIYRELWRITDATIKFIRSNNLDGQDGYSYSSAEMATRGETIIAALMVEAMLPETPKLHQLLSVLFDTVNYCLSHQIKDSVKFEDFDCRGGIKKHINNSRIRIDFVQHVLTIIVPLIYN